MTPFGYKQCRSLFAKEHRGEKVPKDLHKQCKGVKKSSGGKHKK